MKINFLRLRWIARVGALALCFGWAVAPAAESASASARKPTLWIVGDSTANSTPSAANNILGWGNAFGAYFDKSKITVNNSARGGRSSRSYYHEGLWDAVIKKAQPGDFMLLQFGHNDAGTPSVNRAGDRPSLPGLGEETKDEPTPPGTKLVLGASTVAPAAAPDGTTNAAPVNAATPAGPIETVHTFGWYMRKFIAEAKTKQITIIVLTCTVRNNWPNGTLERGPGQYSPWSREIAAAANVPMVDMTNIVADKYEKMARDEVTTLYNPNNTDTTHSSAAGADFNAASIVSGLKALKGNPLGAYFSEKGHAVAAADGKYVSENTPTTKGAESTTTQPAAPAK